MKISITMDRYPGNQDDIRLAIADYKESILQCEEKLMRVKILGTDTFLKKSDIDSLFYFPETCIKSLKGCSIDFQYLIDHEPEPESKPKKIKSKHTKNMYVKKVKKPSPRKPKMTECLTKFNPLLENERLIQDLKK